YTRARLGESRVGTRSHRLAETGGAPGGGQAGTPGPGSGGSAGRQRPGRYRRGGPAHLLYPGTAGGSGLPGRVHAQSGDPAAAHQPAPPLRPGSARPGPGGRAAGLPAGCGLAGGGRGLRVARRSGGHPATGPARVADGHGEWIGLLRLSPVRDPSLLLPFARGQLGLARAGGQLASLPGVVSLVVGAASAWLAAQGVTLLQDRPETMLGMVIGSVFGVLLLNGIPAGPLVASGLAAL